LAVEVAFDYTAESVPMIGKPDHLSAVDSGFLSVVALVYLCRINLAALGSRMVYLVDTASAEVVAYAAEFDHGKPVAYLDSANAEAAAGTADVEDHVAYAVAKVETGAVVAFPNTEAAVDDDGEVYALVVV
jgi:hypothetical protein